GLDEGDRNLHVAACGLGVWARPMRAIDEGRSDLGFDARQADIETSPEDVTIAVEAQVDFGSDGHGVWQRDLHPGGLNGYCTCEGGGPCGCEQLFGIGAGARSAGYREPEVQAAVTRARRPLLASTGRVGLRGVEGLFGWHNRTPPERTKKRLCS